MFRKAPSCASCGFLEVRHVWFKEYDEDPDESAEVARYEAAPAHVRENSKEFRHAVKEKGPGTPFRCSRETFDLDAEIEETFEWGTPENWLTVITRERDCHTFETRVPNMTVAAHLDSHNARVERDRLRGDRMWDLAKTAVPYVMTGLAVSLGVLIGKSEVIREAFEWIF